MSRIRTTTKFPSPADLRLKPFHSLPASLTHHLFTIYSLASAVILVKQLNCFQGGDFEESGLGFGSKSDRQLFRGKAREFHY
jgi:hypothetical protein